MLDLLEGGSWSLELGGRADLRYEPILSQTIVASVDNALAASTPAFLESIRMTTFTCKLLLPYHAVLQMLIDSGYKRYFYTLSTRKLN